MKIEITLETHKIVITSDAIRHGVVRSTLDRAKKVILEDDDEKLLYEFARQVLDTSEH